MNVKPETGCAITEGSIQSPCAPMVYPIIAMQTEAGTRYESDEALQNGTLFPGLNLPFHVEMQARFPSIPKALAELMALDFAIDEMGLYLDTHPSDQEALELFNSYIRLAKQGRAKYQELYGPLVKRYVTEDGNFTWINDPWPWELAAEGGRK